MHTFKVDNWVLNLYPYIVFIVMSTLGYIVITEYPYGLGGWTN